MPVADFAIRHALRARFFLARAKKMSVFVHYKSPSGKTRR